MASDDRSSLWRRLRWGPIAAATVVALLVIGLVPPLRGLAANIASKVILFVASPLAPSTGGFDDLPEASRVLAADGSELGVLGVEQREPVRLSSLPPHVVHAVLAAEDANFYDHSGVDPAAVLRAVFNTAKGDTQGGSTITQQLAKLNYTGSQRTVMRKLREVLYAARLEQRYSKDELLERYLNQVYFGDNAYGIRLAAERFFATSPERLGPAQAATLAGKIQSPSALDPYKDPAAVQARRNQVLRNMAEHGWLSVADLAAAEVEPLRPAPRTAGATAPAGRAPHFVAYVGREAAGLDELGGIDANRQKLVLTGGYTIRTTFDPKAFDEAVAAAKATLGAAGDPTTAVASVQPGDGAIRVLFGGLDPTLEFDPATQGRRQPGSSFKPFVYLAMLRAGIDPRTTFDAGSPKTVDCAGGPWTVRNYEGRGGGATTVDDAMVRSINTVFAQVMARVGPAPTQQAAEDAGVSREAVDPPECAMALGGLRHGVSPLEMAASFATFAARGVYAPPYAITRIDDREGKLVYQHSPTTHRGAEEKEAGVLNAVLQRVVREGTGTAAAIGRPLAGKTGTTENNGNAWFVGYVPQLSTAVWVGRPEGDIPMTNVHGVAVTGGSYPARIFARYMRAALAGVPVQDLYTASPDDLGLRGAPESVVPDGTVGSTVTRPSPDGLPLPDAPSSPPVSFEPPALLPEPPTPPVPPVPTTRAPRPTTTVPRPTTTIASP
ncbi:MAG TPA: transglycosylase domain-containing protein [Acidimicrobiales bacterium]|nr:transglycosylase domain-containing protein [Acidimicrobiales bacterium]